ncbi:hypothetical protein DYI23_08680 [Roseibium polysiphoniae]|uniref:Uncharacterized protein n=1 Tax=Roseibium polysiphoniae TaxID=2571221 RepID=A0A944GSG6_9HYPH|nr:hypothetical protein [Roseibium polysiphoniae]MBS8260289.1 hypothetical protein [Roseibium polysiphoniae]
MFFDYFFERMDLRLFQLITQLKPRDEVTDQTEVDAREATIDKEISGHLIVRKHLDYHDAVFQIFGVIDQKASAVLTHISVMIAVNALLLGTKSSPALDVISVVLLFAFILVALLSLRLLRFWSSRFPAEDAGERPTNEVETQIKNSFRDEIFYRGRLYRFALNTTTLLTALSAVLMILYGFEIAFTDDRTNGTT